MYVQCTCTCTCINFCWLCSVSMKLVTSWTLSYQHWLGRATAVPMGSWSPYSCSQRWRRSSSASLHQIGNNSCRGHGGTGYWWVEALWSSLSPLPLPPSLHIYLTLWFNLQGCQRNVEDWQKILQVRSLVLTQKVGVLYTVVLHTHWLCDILLCNSTVVVHIL